MFNKNEVTLIGRLVADPEARTTPSGNQASKLRVATNRYYTNSAGEKVEEVEYHTVDVYGGNAEFCNRYLRKGRFVHVSGRIKTTEYEQDGTRKWYTSIIGRVDPLDPKPQDASEPLYNERSEEIPF